MEKCVKLIAQCKSQRTPKWEKNKDFLKCLLFQTCMNKKNITAFFFCAVRSSRGHLHYKKFSAKLFFIWIDSNQGTVQ